LRDAENRYKRSDQAIQRHKKQQRDLQVQQQRAEEEVERLQDELEADTPQTGVLEALETDLQNAKEAKQMQENAMQDALEEKEKLDRKQHELKQQLNASQKETQEIEAKINKATAKIHKLAEKRHTALLEKNRAFQLIQDAKDEKDVLQEKRAKQEERIAEFATQASSICARVPVDANETPNSLDAKLSRLIKDKQRYEEQYVSPYRTMLGRH